MKGLILCPKCIEKGRKPKVLAKYEDIKGKGAVYLWCKKCNEEIKIDIEKMQ